MIGVGAVILGNINVGKIALLELIVLCYMM